VPSNSDAATSGAALAGLAVGGIFFLALFVFFIFVYYRIAAKAGYNGWLSLLMLVPLVNFVIILMFAFTEWPIERERNALRAGMGGGGYPPQGGFGGGSPFGTPQPPAPPQLGTWGPPTTSG
jgi:amino acid transporter